MKTRLKNGRGGRGGDQQIKNKKKERVYSFHCDITSSRRRRRHRQHNNRIKPITVEQGGAMQDRGRL